MDDERTTMTDIDLAAIEARANAATEGPWELFGPYAPDAAFIAHARDDVPALVARVRELEAAPIVHSTFIRLHSALAAESSLHQDSTGHIMNSTPHLSGGNVTVSCSECDRSVSIPLAVATDG